MHLPLALLTLPLIALSAPLQGKANTATIKNSCPYPINLQSSGPATIGGDLPQTTIAPSGEYSEALRGEAIALKTAKVQDFVDYSTKTTLFEYSYVKATNQIWYNLSFIRCVQNNGTDMSQCPGHEFGVQANCAQTTTCPPNDIGTCGGDSYLKKHDGDLNGSPVSVCDAAKGVTFELCYQNRK